VSTTEERLAFLEGWAGEHAHVTNDIRYSLNRLEARLSLFEDRVGRRFGVIEARLTALDEKLDRKIDSLDQKFDRKFTWLAGLQVTTLITIAAALLAK
jgi:hypothetical protein